jgi:hypothetical protein
MNGTNNTKKGIENKYYSKVFLPASELLVIVFCHTVFGFGLGSGRREFFM